MQIAPGIHRLGSGLINAYLLEEGGLVTIVDAGAPGYWRDLGRELAAMGRSLEDVRAVVLTHAHTDHVGFAERIRRERAVPIRVHRDDAALARGEMKPVRDEHAPSMRMRPLAVLRFGWFGVTHGMTGAAVPIQEVTTFDDGATLDVPGAPQVVHVPGHTAGSVALHVPGRDAIFVGDAFVTTNVMSGRTGPHYATMFNADNRQAVASLARFDGLAARLVLPGHGAAFDGGLATALRLVRDSLPAELRARGQLAQS